MKQFPWIVDYISFIPTGNEVSKAKLEKINQHVTKLRKTLGINVKPLVKAPRYDR